MTAPSDTNAHTTISKLRSRFSALGKGGVSKSGQTSPSTATPDQVQTSAHDGVHHGIDYSPNARNFEVKQSLRQLYPAIDAFKTGMLKVDDRHEIYWEVCGNEHGAPGEIVKKRERMVEEI